MEEGGVSTLQSDARSGLEEIWLPLELVAGTVEKMKLQPEEVQAEYRSRYAAFLDDPAEFLAGTGAFQAEARIETAILHQGSSQFQGFAEYIANGIDTLLEKEGASPIGRFGVGAFMGLSLLKRYPDPEARIHVATFGGDMGAPRRLSYRYRADEEGRDRFEITWARAAGAHPQGTTVEVKLPGVAGAPAFIADGVDYLRRRFGRNRTIPIFLTLPDGRRVLLNDLGGLRDSKGKPLTHRFPEAGVEVAFLADQDLIRIQDGGLGMPDPVILEKLLDLRASTRREKGAPGGPRKTALRPEGYELIHRLRPAGDLEAERLSRISPLVNGQGIEWMDDAGPGLPEEFFIEMPASSWVPESRDKVRLTPEEALLLARKILDSPFSVQEKAQMLNAFARILRAVQERVGEEVIQPVVNLLRSWVGGLRGAGILVFPNQAGFYRLSTGGKEVVYLDADLLDFRPEQIPGAEQVRQFESRDWRMFLVKARDPEMISFEHGSTLFFNRVHFDPHRSNPAPVDLWMEEVWTPVTAPTRERPARAG